MRDSAAAGASALARDARHVFDYSSMPINFRSVLLLCLCFNICNTVGCLMPSLLVLLAFQQGVHALVLLVTRVRDVRDFGPVGHDDDQQEQRTTDPEHAVHVVILH